MSRIYERLPLAYRLWRHFRKVESGCWEWNGAVCEGYGRIGMAGRSRLAHRVMYELLVEPIGEGLTIDHLCRNTRCVNPSHLETVTASENVKRGDPGAYLRARTRCPQGHEYTPENTYRDTKGRSCRECARDNARRWRRVGPIRETGAK